MGREYETDAGDGGDGGEKTKYTIIYDAQGNAYTKDVNRPNDPPIPMTMPNGAQPAPQGSSVDGSVTAPPASFRKAVAPPREPKAFTLDQSNSAIYGKRAMQSDTALGAVGQDYDPMAVYTKNAVGGIPLVGGLAEMSVNKKLTPKEQSVDQAQRNFISAVLRKESGATISPTEFENATKQYFQQPGDTQEVLVQKAQNRATAIEGLKNSAGPAWIGDGAEGSAPQKSVVRTGMVNGRKVVQYSDGTKAYAE
jgi:hypothetical protein